MRCLSGPILVTSLALVCTVTSPAGAAKPPALHSGQCQAPTGASPSARGKYAGLIRRIHKPSDCAGYGSYHDWGYYPATSYGGAQNLPAAYWVYVYPHWYVWRTRVRQPPFPVVTPPPMPPPSAQRCVPPPQVTPDAAGRYRSLVRRLYVPADCAIYGAYRDYGQYPATSYAGVRNLPAGYWVYVYPYWYLWRRMGRQGP